MQLVLLTSVALQERFPRRTLLMPSDGVLLLLLLLHRSRAAAAALLTLPLTCRIRVDELLKYYNAASHHKQGVSRA